MVNVPTIKLNSGYDMPQVGFGLWKVDKEIAADVVYNAIKVGYRLFDGAAGESPIFPHPIARSLPKISSS
jgi:D-xylose reductase